MSLEIRDLLIIFLCSGRSFYNLGKVGNGVFNLLAIEVDYLVYMEAKPSSIRQLSFSELYESEERRRFKKGSV